VSKTGALVAIPIVVLVAMGLALAGSQDGATVQGIPVFALAVAVIFAVQWLAFVVAFALGTEGFFDLTGAATYIGVTIMAVLLSPAADARTILLAALVVIWAARLGTFLVRRIRKAGKDERFDEIKVSFVRFLSAWTIQGLWIALTAGAALAAIAGARKEPDVFAAAGLAVWVAGFGIEAVADFQKSRFRASPANKGRFISSGLWSWSRHPNYFGEIVLWAGVAVIALPVLQGWQLVTLVSPFFVALLLTRVSGIPILEKRADAKWGGRPDYETYKKRTSVLIPLPPRGAR
jgi:steroid 5-alpha reductase family enzyme